MPQYYPVCNYHPLDKANKLQSHNQDPWKPVFVASSQGLHSPSHVPVLTYYPIAHYAAPCHPGITIGIAAFRTEIIKCLIFLVAGDDLGGKTVLLIAESTVIGMIIDLLFIRASCRPRIVVTACSIAITTDKARHLFTKLMLNPSPERFVTPTVTIAIYAICRVRLDVVAFAVLKGSCYRDTSIVVHLTLETTTVFLITVGTQSSRQICSICIRLCNDVNDPPIASAPYTAERGPRINSIRCTNEIGIWLKSATPVIPGFAIGTPSMSTKVWRASEPLTYKEALCPNPRLSNINAGQSPHHL